jgi:hypothetical protein
MNELNVKLEELLSEYDMYVQEGIIVTESERARVVQLAKMLQQYAKDLNTHKSMKEFIAAHKENSTE